MNVEKAEGLFFGLAIGDAMGAPVEFKDPNTFPQVVDFQSGGKFNLEPGEWTDDTAMALCLAEALSETSELDSKKLLDLFLKWIMEGYHTTRGKAIGIGKQTFKVLLNYRKNGDLVSPFTASKYSGNGALMRMGPVAIKYFHSLHLTQKYAEQSAATTHSSAESLQTARLFGGILNRLLNHSCKDDLADFIRQQNNHSKHAAMRNILTLNFEAMDKSNSGYAPLSLEAAIYAFYSTSTFEDGLLQVVNNGMDSDTVGAIYGQMAGAYYGMEAIPKNWVQGLKHLNLLQNSLNALILSAEIDKGEK
jgi:ADP-ribosyl-[dinitrogen reductase] hydrolase